MKSGHCSTGRRPARAAVVAPIFVLLACAGSAPASQQPQNAAAVIPTTGGSVELVGVATVTFPDGAFSSPRQVTLSATSMEETQDLYVMSGRMLSFGPRAPWELRINSGDASPQTPMTVALVVPTTLLDSLPADYEIAVLAQLLQSGGQDLLDNFVRVFTATFDSLSNTISAELSVNVFTDQRTADDTFEAIVVVGSGPIL